MRLITVFGSAAAIASMASFAPQAWRIVKTRDTRGLATPMWILSVIAFALWTTYGVLLGEWPLIIENAVCFVLSSFILAMKVIPRHQRDAVADVLDPSHSS